MKYEFPKNLTITKKEHDKKSYLFLTRNKKIFP